ncbi:MAG: DMT family transporter, partial [Planctomycetes bacterium]|nr:DMT family transporter [Planctomycetota bacterium]
MNRSAVKADALLLLAAMIWGTGFVAQRVGMDHVGPMTFTAVRFAIGSLVLLPFILLQPVGRRETGLQGPSARPARHIRYGTLAGSVLFVGASLQQTGLVHTTAGKAGFITGLYVLFVPLIGLFLRHRIRATTWAGCILATVGLYYLSLSEAMTVNPGDGLVLACAVVWAG